MFTGTMGIKQQSGAVLAISLILLVTLTLLGLSSLRNTTIQEKMSGNYKSCKAAFQSSEAALRAGEAWIQSQTSRPPSSVSNQIGSNVWSLNSPSLVVGTPNWWDQVNTAWWADDDNATEYIDPIQSVAARPHYVIEEQSYIKNSLNLGMKSDTTGRVIYRVTSRGVGASAQTKSILQSTYSRRF